MAEVVLFHHALGLTDAVLAFAGSVREAGHTVHTPDLYEGKTFPSISAGVANAEEIGFGTVIERGWTLMQGMNEGLVLAGFSLGVLPAQSIAQKRPGALGGLFCHGVAPPEMLGGEWPDGLPLQMHFMEDDPWADEDLEVARELDDAEAAAELHLYPGSGHLFTEPLSDAYDPAAAALLLERSLAFLDRIDREG